MTVTIYIIFVVDSKRILKIEVNFLNIETTQE